MHVVTSGGHNRKVVSVSPSKQKPPSDHYTVTTCSFSSLPSNVSPTTTTKSMDEIWKDINLISSLHRPNAAVPATNSSTAFHLQDFLPPPPPPFTKVNPPPPRAQRQRNTGCRGGPHSSTTHPPPQPPPATTLSLTSGLDSRNMNPNKSKSKQQSRNDFVEKASLISSLNPTRSSSCGTWHSFKNKRPAETEEDHSADCRFKRMIKNRESAARSRDRKHAYTYELELEVARLKKENAKLRRQQAMFCLPATPPAQLPKKPTLCRTLTAPF